MKICTKCKIEQDELEFCFDSETKDYLSSWCRNCKNILHFAHYLHHRYNLTINQYKLMLESQNGVCAICNQSETRKSRSDKICRLSVDHNHKTNKIRGLLCNQCNIQLRTLEDLDWLLKAQEYLEKYK